MGVTQFLRELEDAKIVTDMAFESLIEMGAVIWGLDLLCLIHARLCNHLDLLDTRGRGSDGPVIFAGYWK